LTFYNKVILIGNLAEDADTRYTPSGSQVTKLSLLINSDEGPGEGQHLQTIDVVALERGHRFQGRSLMKGGWVLVEGRIKSRVWETQEGQKRKKLEIIAERIYPLKE